METQRDIDDLLRCVATRTWELFREDPFLYVLGCALWGVAGTLTAGILLGPLLVGFIDVVRRRTRNEEAALLDLFGVTSHWVSAIVAALLHLVATAVGLLLFVLPGLVVLLLFLFSYHYIAYHNLRAGSALRESFRLVKSNPVAVTVVAASLVLLNLVGGSVLFGPFLTAPLSLIAITVMFEELTGAADTLPVLDDEVAPSTA